MRTKLYFRNLITGTGNMVVNTILQIVLRWFFIKTLGADFLGLNGLFVSIFAVLSLVDLGIGGVIGFSLYAPLSQNDQRKVAALVRFYRNAYTVMALIVLVVGLALMPFLQYVIKTDNSIANLNYLYLISLFSTVSGYFFSYNQVLLNSDQRGYVATKINMFFSIFNAIALIIVLAVSHSYVFYMITSTVLSIILQFIIFRKVRVLYEYIYQIKDSKLSKSELSDIYRNVKAMFLHRIGDIAINSTDNLIISKFVSLASVGYFSNYYMMLNIASRFIDSVFSSMVASFGQIFAGGANNRAKELFSTINFLCFWIYGFVSVVFLCLASPLVTLLFGDKFALSPAVVALLALNFYITGMRVPPYIVKSAAGIFVQDKYIPIIQAMINLIFSIIAVQYLGMVGVFLGTFASSILPSLIRPYYACKYGLSCSAKPYFQSYALYISVFLTLGASSNYFCSLFFSDPTLFALFGRLVICTLLFNLVVFAMFYKSVHFIELKVKVSSLIISLRDKVYGPARIS